MNIYFKKSIQDKKLTALLVLITIIALILVSASIILTHQYIISPVNAITYLFLSIVENYNTPNTLALISFKT